MRNAISKPRHIILIAAVMLTVAVVLIAAGITLTSHISHPPVPAERRRFVIPVRVVHSPHYTLILVPVFINGRGPYPFLFDTGAGYVTMASDLAARVRIHVRDMPTQVAMFGKTQHSGWGEATSVRVGGATVPNVQVSVTDFGPYRTATGGLYDGIIGCDYMRHFRITLDIAKNQLILEEPK